jgi:hypothetical protein
LGLLDDAIREHLDLKRRRGADPAEVERAEHEALGPVRRGPEESRDADLSHDPDEDRGLAYDLEDEQDWHDAGPEDEPEPSKKRGRKFFQRKSRPAREPEHDDDDERDGPVLHDFEEPPVFADDLAGDEPAESRSRSTRQSPSAPRKTRATPDPPPAAAPPPAEHAGGETVEYDVEGALKGNKTDEGDDVLEETPEFLHDTPEHDRLWFEQRPPRDFDFEG